MPFRIYTRSLKFALMGSSVVFLSAPAFGQDASSTQSGGAGAVVQDKSVEAVVVTGTNSLANGLMKVQNAPEATSSVTAAAIETKPAAGLPLNLITSLPGVNFGNSNSFGLDIRNFISVRGLDEQQMGWVLEGMPAQDQTQNFPQTQFWADNENIADMTLIAGTTRLHDPVETASGGEVIETVRDPSDQFGTMASLSAGSFDSQRYFGRVDTGLLGNSGVSGFGSFSYTTGKNFIFPEAGHRSHLDLKLDKDWGSFGTSKWYFAFTDLKDVRLNTLTQAQFNQEKAADDFTIAGQYSPTYTPGTSNYYKSAISNYETILTSVQNSFALSDNVSLLVTPYGHVILDDGGAMMLLNPNSIYAGNQKISLNPANLTFNSNGTFPVNNDVVYRSHGEGINTVLQWDINPTNTLRIGYWFDHFRLDVNSQNLPVGPNGETDGPALIATNGLPFTGQSFYLDQFIHDINIADTQTFMDGRLQLNVGFKELFTNTDGLNRVPGPQTNFHGQWTIALPRASVLYKLDDDMQIYANVTTNTKPPIPVSTFTNNYSITSGALSQVANPRLPAEYAVGEEVGYRYYGSFNFDVALFNMQLDNHQISSQNNVNGLLIPQVINIGGESLRGASVEASTELFDGFSPYANVQYLDTRLDSNLPVGSSFLPTEGKAMVESPKWVTNVGLNYQKDGFFGSATFKYVSSQFTTFMNDEVMPSHGTLDMSVGYQWDNVGLVQEPMIRLTMTNINSGAYLGTVSGLQLNALNTRALDGTNVAGKAATYYISPPFSFMITLSGKM